MLKNVFSELKEGISNLSSRFSGNFSSTIDNISQAVIPRIIDVLTFLIEKARDLVDFISNNWDKIIDVANRVKESFLEISDGALSLVGNIRDSLQPVIEGFLEKIETVVDWLITNGLPFIVDGFTNIIDGATNIYNFINDNWSLIGPIIAGIATAIGFIKFTSLITGIGSLVAALGPLIVTTWGQVTATLAANTAFLASPITWIAIAIGALVTVGILLYKNWDKIKEKTLQLWDSMKNFISDISEKFPIIGTIIATIKDYIITQFNNIKQIFTGVIEFVTGVFTGDWERAWTGVTNIFGGIFDGIVGMAKVPINGASGIINNLIQGINNMSIDIPDWVPGLGGKKFSINIPEIPMFAKGTDNSPSTFIAGERGAELITNREHSKVFTAFETGNIVATIDKLQNTIRKIPMLENILLKFSDDNSTEKENYSNYDLLSSNKPLLFPQNNGERKVEINYAPNVTVTVTGSGKDINEIQSLIEKMLAKDKLELITIIKNILKDEENRKVRLSNG